MGWRAACMGGNAGGVQHSWRMCGTPLGQVRPPRCAVQGLWRSARPVGAGEGRPSASSAPACGCAPRRPLQAPPPRPRLPTRRRHRPPAALPLRRGPRCGARLTPPPPPAPDQRGCATAVPIAQRVVEAAGTRMRAPDVNSGRAGSAVRASLASPPTPPAGTPAACRRACTKRCSLVEAPPLRCSSHSSHIICGCGRWDGWSGVGVAWQGALPSTATNPVGSHTHQPPRSLTPRSRMPARSQAQSTSPSHRAVVAVEDVAPHARVAGEVELDPGGLRSTMQYRAVPYTVQYRKIG